VCGFVAITDRFSQAPVSLTASGTQTGVRRLLIDGRQIRLER
jgi:hypothetical protein